MRSVKHAILLAAALTAILVAAAPAAQAVVGTRDFQYSTAVSAPTGQKPQSKLWFNDGLWWGVLWSKTNARYDIYKFNWAANTWSDTGVAVDTRTKGQADVLWSGGKLYVTINVPKCTPPSGSTTCTQTADSAGKLRRYSYDSSTKTYTLDSGFPITLETAPVEALVIDRDSKGRLWATWTQDTTTTRTLFVRHSSATSDTSWGAAFTPSLQGTTNLELDDISAIVAFKGQDGIGKVGVMWSNQTDGTMHFGVHKDSDADSQWIDQPAITGPHMADDHMALRALNADPSGEVVAVFKTSLNDVNPSTSTEPLIYLGVRKSTGTWTKTVFSRVVDNHTRAILEIDRTNRQIYVFASSPCCNGGSIYYKKTSLDNPDFSGQTGLGTPFIQDGVDLNVNNPTSTKQDLTSATGLLLEASDDKTKYYVHNKLDLTPTTAPSAPAITSPATNTYDKDGAITLSGTAVPGSTVTVLEGTTSKGTTTATSTGTWSYALTGVPNGAHTYTATAANSAGTSPASNAVTITVDTVAPAPPVIKSPANGATNTTGSLTVSGTAEAGSTVQLFDGTTSKGSFKATTTGTWSKALSGLAAGTHTFTAKSTDAAGNVSAVSNAVTVTVSSGTTDTTPPTVTGVTPANGATGVPSNTAVKVTFSEAMNAATITASTVTLAQGATGIPATVTYDAPSNTATLTPTSGLADATTYTFGVKGGTGGVTDAAGNALAASFSATFTTASGTSSGLFADGFESGDFSQWSLVKTGADGTATVQSTTVKTGTFAAKLVETSTPGSIAYIRKTFASGQTDLTVAGDFDVQAEGASGGNVPLLRLFGTTGTRLVSLYRQNLATDKVYVTDGTTRALTTGTLPLNTWKHFVLHVVANGTGTSTVTLTIDGAPVFSTTTMNVPTTGIGAIQVGNETAAQAGTFVADNISAS